MMAWGGAMQTIKTRDGLIHQIANAKKVNADITAALQRSAPAQKEGVRNQLRLGEEYQRDLEVILEQYDRDETWAMMALLADAGKAT